MSKSQAARTFSVSVSSVKRYVKKGNHRESLAPKKSPGSLWIYLGWWHVCDFGLYTERNDLLAIHRQFIALCFYCDCERVWNEHKGP
jgi:hypothetical protein